MYDYLIDCPDRETVQPRSRIGAEAERSHDVFASGCTTVPNTWPTTLATGTRTWRTPRPKRPWLREQAKVSRARGGQIGWVRHVLQRGAVARFGYRNPIEMVASRLDVRRSTARDLGYLAARLVDNRIESVRSGAISYERTLAETRLAEAGASTEVIEGSRDLDLEAVKRVLQAHRRMTRAAERRAGEGQYLSL